MYYQTGGSLGRKRGRENDSESDVSQGFREHRAKRQLSSLPFRRSPEGSKYPFPSLRPNPPHPQNPTFADITPAGSDSEDVPSIREPHSFFSPCSSSPLADSFMGSSQPSSCFTNTAEGHDALDRFAFSDDMEMIDSGLLHPPALHPDLANPLTSRVPTPIHASFSHYGGPADKMTTFIGSSLDSLDAMGRRLPSPISEDEKGSSAFSRSLAENDVDMKEGEQDMPTEPKSTLIKGHLRVRHSTRSWGANPSDTVGSSSSIGLRRGFSMGYRGDCEKCRNRVPGHFSHIINYEIPGLAAQVG